MKTRKDQPTIDFVAACIVNHVAGDLLPELEQRKPYVKSGKYKEWHAYASRIIGGYFVRKPKDLKDYLSRINKNKHVSVA